MNSCNSNQQPRDKLLDIAEFLFSKRGFYGVSVREITEDAGLRLASVNYYFKTKEGLFQAVLVRRAMTVIEERKLRLAQIDFAKISREEAVAELVLAIVEPLYQRALEGEPSWRAYISLIANVATTEFNPANDLTPLNALDQISVEFIEALRNVSKSKDERQAHHVFQFITGTTLSMISNNGRINKLSNNRYRSDDYSKIYPDMIKFIKQGALAILSE